MHSLDSLRRKSIMRERALTRLMSAHYATHWIVNIVISVMRNNAEVVGLRNGTYELRANARALRMSLRITRCRMLSRLPCCRRHVYTVISISAMILQFCTRARARARRYRINVSLMKINNIIHVKSVPREYLFQIRSVMYYSNVFHDGGTHFMCVCVRWN